MKTIMIVPELPCKHCHKYESNACVECFNKNGKIEQVPETMAELGKIVSDLAFEKRCKMRYMADNDGSFFVCKDGEMYLFEETREMTVERLYHKLIWLLGEKE